MRGRAARVLRMRLPTVGVLGVHGIRSTRLDGLVGITQVRAGLTAWDGDSRFACRQILATNAYCQVAAALVVCDTLARHLPVDYLPESSLRECAPDTAVTVIGGVARLRGGGAYALSSGPEALRPLVDAAVATARASARLPVAFGVPSAQLPAFVSLTARPSTIWSTLRIGGADEAGFLHAAPRRVRQTWARDLRDHAALDLAFDRVPLTATLLDEAGALFAAVQQRNGVRTLPELAAYQVQRWAAGVDGDVFCWTARDAGAALRGVAVMRTTPERALDVYEVGLDCDPGIRRALYSSMVFVLPLREALRTEIRVIDYGTGHPRPKLLRGCVGEQLWHLE